MWNAVLLINPFQINQSIIPVHRVTDINVVDTAVLPAPEYLCREVPRTEAQAAFVAQSRKQIHEIIFGSDSRFLLVLGPCSIHDMDAGIEYARRLTELSRKVSDRIYLVMRAYFEKPRTTVGWKGLIMDPHLDGTYDIPSGLKSARRFLRDLIDLGVPTATELLDPITPQYIADLISWSAIGARTAESQTHRQMASGLSMPLGIKNSTSGNIQNAINAIKAASQPQTFLGISYQGLASSITTRGNPDCHIILRGGDNGPNYSADNIRYTAEKLSRNNVRPAIMVDCSHDNSGKDASIQPQVHQRVIDEMLEHKLPVIGGMLESNLKSGNQKFPQSKENLKYGVSITDACIDWDTTESLVLKTWQIKKKKTN